MYDKIYELVKMTDSTERAVWILEHLNNAIVQSSNSLSNIISEGTDTRILYMAHYDVINKFCANDNSASVINLLAFKKLFPYKTVVFTDKEEPPFMGMGAKLLCSYIREKNVQKIVNCELTGYGSNILFDETLDLVNVGEPCHFSFSDANIIKQEFPNIVKVNTIITFRNDKKIIYHCHSDRDSIDKINLKDMQFFVERLLPNIDFV